MSLSWGVRAARSFAALVVLLPGAAQAAEVRWSGDSKCRRELEVAEQVEGMTERRLAEVTVADFELVLDAPTDAGFALTLVTTPRSGAEPSRRAFRGASCAEVTDAAAVAIALTIGERPSSVEAAPPAPPAAPAAAPSPPPQKAELRRSLLSSWRVGASGVVDTAVTPHASLGGMARVAFARGRLRAELEGAAFAPARVVDAQGRGGSFQLVYLAPLACLASPLGRAQVLLCPGYEVGRLTAVGEGVATPYERDVFWHAVRAEAGAVLPLNAQLWLSGRLGAAFALARPSFVLDAPESVHRPSSISLRASVGLELAL